MLSLLDDPVTRGHGRGRGRGRGRRGRQRGEVGPVPVICGEEGGDSGEDQELDLTRKRTMESAEVESVASEGSDTRSSAALDKLHEKILQSVPEHIRFADLDCDDYEPSIPSGGGGLENDSIAMDLDLEPKKEPNSKNTKIPGVPGESVSTNPALAEEPGPELKHSNGTSLAENAEDFVTAVTDPSHPDPKVDEVSKMVVAAGEEPCRGRDEVPDLPTLPTSAIPIGVAEGESLPSKRNSAPSTSPSTSTSTSSPSSSSSSPDPKRKPKRARTALPPTLCVPPSNATAKGNKTSIWDLSTVWIHGHAIVKRDDRGVLQLQFFRFVEQYSLIVDKQLLGRQPQLCFKL